MNIAQNLQSGWQEKDHGRVAIGLIRVGGA